MLKNILNLGGAKKLTKNEQKSINGGGAKFSPETGWCFSNYSSCEDTYPKSYAGGWCCER
ncbi:hypothetical protein [Flavobacterium sp. PL02]|uniref:hypothetical protein n=1 Tax=Flavobacterium sp. PL02 TaxID=3088354 RepID=UPI002B222D42|nr:hypothetical protein [Flavobacterium sp. PL02]MEA9413929.1 hypothetical protein [Flavobacterium sp. PL02]